MHNLKNVDIKIPKNKITVITGVSGSGKSTIAFDTVYKEGQYRYIESLSTYLRGFFTLGDRPQIQTSIGLAPAIAIEQNKKLANIRSSVGTLTECDDFLRLIFSKIGQIYCPSCGQKIQAQTVLQIVDNIFKEHKNKKILILSQEKNIKTQKELDKFIRQNRKKAEQGGGYNKLIIEQNEQYYTYFYLEDISLAKFPIKVFGLYDKLTVNDENKQRIEEDLIKLFTENNKVNVLAYEKLYSYTIFAYCAKCNIKFPEYTPAHFTPNRIEGACQVCNGLGKTLQVDIDAIIDETQKVKNAIIPWRDSTLGQAILDKLLWKYGYSKNIVWQDLPDDIKHIIIHGDGELLRLNLGGTYVSMYYNGIEKLLSEQYNRGTLPSDIKAFVSFKKCHSCQGKKLNQLSLSVKLNIKNHLYDIADLQEITIKQLHALLKDYYKKTKTDTVLKKRIFGSLLERLETIIDLGLGHLSLSRRVNTLSGGEIQRLRLAKQLGNKLSGIIYVLDEPTIGLDKKETLNTIKAIKTLKKLGNTIIVVEHNEDFIKNADYIIEVGPGAGDFGGKILFSGKLEKFLKTDCLTAKYIRGEKQINIKFEHKPLKKSISIKKAHKYNLQNIDVDIPLGSFTIITGPSGAGKTTLLYDILYNFFQDKEKFIQGYVRRKLLNKGYSWTEIISKYLISPQDYAKYEKQAIVEFFQKLEVDTILGWQDIKNVVYIDQSAIGKNPRSCPATFIGVFDDIRSLFGQTTDAKLLGINTSYFSFNSKKGNCPECNGYGYKKIELQFLPDTFVTCQLCKGKRYRPEILQIKWNGKNIYEVLDMYIYEALEFFKDIPYIKEKLEYLVEIGVGYLKMGQPAHTLSGGESQRLKIVKNLIKKYKGHTIYFLDEPTVGLHPADIERLLKILKKILHNQHTIVMIEHDQNLLKFADKVIRLEDGRVVRK